MRICGLDECGRGAWAGPLVAAAVVLGCSRQKLTRVAGTRLRDSKRLNARQREKVYRALKKTGAEVAVEVISDRQINNRGIGWANREIFRRLVKKIEADGYIADGTIKIGRIAGKTSKIKSVVDADEKIAEVRMASVAAKVTRDKIMRELDREHPKYGWRVNKGYGTTKHIEAIKKHGVVKYHRGVFVTTALRSKMS